MKYNEDLKTALANKELFNKTLKKWKKKKVKMVDETFSELHDQAFQKIDCLSCANCCKTTSPIFRDVDVRRISKSMRMTEMQFISSYLQMDEEKDYVLKSAPCTFLGSDNKCSIYEIRPLACREYPHTNRKNIQQIFDITLKNAEICPAVSRILTKITEMQG
jgi:Fe-S-cluster containining protein